MKKGLGDCSGWRLGSGSRVKGKKLKKTEKSWKKLKKAKKAKKTENSWGGGWFVLETCRRAYCGSNEPILEVRSCLVVEKNEF